MKNYTFVNDKTRENILVISWEYTYNGVVLELSYTSFGTEKELYRKFVKYINQAVNDGVLPLQLAKCNWYDWETIENHANSRQYSIITDSAGETTLFWKSTFVDDFFASSKLTSV